MNSLSRSIRRFIFSTECVICGSRDTRGYDHICDPCFERVRRIKKLTRKGRYFYLYIYKNEMRRLITAFKLENKKRVGFILARLAERELRDIITENRIDTIIPVPISGKRLRERGFNQVEELLERMGLNYWKIFRIKDTEHMYNLEGLDLRKENVKDAFRIGRDLNGRRILIFDDIVTTGATVEELIREIEHSSSPEEIYIFSLAASESFSRKNIENRRR